MFSKTMQKKSSKSKPIIRSQYWTCKLHYEMSAHMNVFE